MRLLLVALLLKLALIAAIASVLVRSVLFKRYLYKEERSLREKLIFVLYLTIPLAGGVGIRLLVKSFSMADLTVPGAMLIGLLAGQIAGLAGGAVIALPALWVHEWLSLPMALLAGWCGGLCRRVAPDYDEIWAFSPFIDLELWRWLRNRLDRPFRDWQALLFAVLILLTLAELELAHAFPRLLYAIRPVNAWGVAVVVFTTVLTVAIPIKIWNNSRIERQLDEQKRLLVQARLDALTSQINPHFLFNTLNSIASLIRLNPDRARRLIVQLSNILRRLLETHDNHVPLRHEVAFIQDYLAIELERFGPEKLRVTYDIDPQALDCLVPSMLLQPIVENSIRHGLSPKLQGGAIAVRAWQTDGQVRIEIKDDGVGYAPGAGAPLSGIGLANVRERLRVLYGAAAKLDIESRVGEGTDVRIMLPKVAAIETASRPETFAAKPGGLT